MKTEDCERTGNTQSLTNDGTQNRVKIVSGNVVSIGNDTEMSVSFFLHRSDDGNLYYGTLPKHEENNYPSESSKLFHYDYICLGRRSAKCYKLKQGHRYSISLNKNDQLTLYDLD